MSRDLFYRPDGSKRCGELVRVELETPVNGKLVIEGVIWDTMNPRFVKRVDVLVAPNEPAFEYGKREGVLRWEE